MSFLGIGHSKQFSTELHFDIGSSSVRATIVSFSKKDGKCNPTITYSTVESIPVAEHLSFTTFLKSMTDSLIKSSFSVQKNIRGKPDSVRVFLASPWYTSQSRICTYEKSAPFTVTQKILDDVYKREVETFTKEELAKYQDGGDSARIIENRVVSIRLNGYDVPNPFGKKAETVEASLFLSASPEIILTTIENVMKRVFHSSKVSFFPFTLVAYQVAKELFLTVNDFLLIDIGGEVSDVLMIKNGAAVATASFPYGKNFLSRRIAVKQNISISDAQTLFSLYVSNQLEETKKISLQTILKEAEADWLKGFQNALQVASREFVVPETIFVTTDLNVSPWFVEALQSEDFHRYTLTSDKFTLYTFEVPLLSKKVAVSSGVLPDVFGMIEAMFACNLKQ